jgi:hypothetical protein
LVAVRFVDPPKSDLLAAEEFKLTIGDTAFDAADRLAIINLFGAYAYTYDENELDEFRALLTDAPELVLRHENRMLSQDIDTEMNFLAARKAAFKAENNQRRHALKLLLVHPPKRHWGDWTLLCPAIRYS